MSYALWMIHAYRRQHGELLAGRNDVRTAALVATATKRYLAKLDK